MNARTIAGFLVVSTILAAVISGPSGAQKADAPTWQKFLPKSVFQELVRREAKIAEKFIVTDDFEALQRGKVAALMIAGYTMSTKEGENLKPIRNAALRLASILGDKSKAGEAKKLVAAIVDLKGEPSLPDQDTNFRKYLLNDYYLMVPYMATKKGGDGLHPKLQFSSRLRGTQEFIENLFSYVSRRPLKSNYVESAAKELELVGYRTAVSGQLIAAYQPRSKSKKRDPVVWRASSKDMIATALDMAAAAQKKDAVALQKATGGILKSCVTCHKVFQ